MDKKRPQLSHDELLQLKWLLGGALTLLAIATVFYMEVNAWLMLAVVGGASVATLVWPTLPARMPPAMHTLAFPVIVAFFAGDLWLRTEVLPAMVRLDMLLLLYRATTYRRRRDDLQIIVLGLFLVVVAGVLSVSLLFAIHILLYTSCALAFLLAITLADDGASGGTGARGEVELDDGEVPSWAAHANWPALFRRLRGVTDWRIVTFGAALFVGVVGVSALLFLAIPRFQLENSLFLDRLITKKARSGFSDTIRFGDVSEIQLDRGVALTIDGVDQTQIPVTPYWRMLVLDNYRNETFTRSRESEFGAASKRAQISGTRSAGGAEWKFYLESGVSRFLPLPGEFGLLRFAEPQNVSQSVSRNLVRLAEEPVTMTAYLVQGIESSDALPDATFAKSWRDSIVSDTPRPTEGRVQLSDRDREKLARIGREAAGAPRNGTTETIEPGLNAGAFAQRTNTWLRSNHGYTLSPVIPGGDGDPLLRWM
ncbi:MAG: DUF3488 domain-containing protein, partial [Opitutaceae bacterium]